MKFTIVVLSLAVLLVSSANAFAEDAHIHGDQSSAEATTDPGEKAADYCPLCGPEEEMHGLAFSYKHEGKKYSFCSMECLKAFRKNPERFIQKMEQEE